MFQDNFLGQPNYLTSPGNNCLIELDSHVKDYEKFVSVGVCVSYDITKQLLLMTGPMGNSDFCLSPTLNIRVSSI